MEPGSGGSQRAGPGEPSAANPSTFASQGEDVATICDEPSSPAAAAARAEVPPRIGRYMTLRKLGEGSMGEVLLGYDEHLDRRVAIKIVSAMGQRAGEVYARMLREAQGLARLSHPNVVQVYEAGEFDGRVFLAMEYVEGVTLRAWSTMAVRTWREVLDRCMEAGRGLAAAHAAGLVHRDFKPKTRSPSQTAPLPPFGRILARRGDPRGVQRRVVPRHAAALATEWQRAARQRATPRFCLGA